MQDTALLRLLDIMRQLRDPEHGCPWDIKQDFDSIVPHTIEEAYEVADAIASGDPAAIQDELGDLLFQVVFYAQLGRERGWFGFDDIAAGVSDKLIRRHPHVFGDVTLNSEQAIKEQWEQIKAEERKARSNQAPSVFDGVPGNLPAMLKAYKIQKRCANVGFDWHKVSDVLAKVREEVTELEQALGANELDTAHIEEELGDLLFAVVNVARHVKANPETALRKANQKFMRRFRFIEQRIAALDDAIEDYSLHDLEELWQQAKQT